MLGPTFLMAIRLVLVFEGLAPFVAPALWRDAVQRVALLRDGQLRFMGITAMLAGIALLFLAR